jgi:hypothetical protein
MMLVAANAFAQAKPNFAGTWVREAPAGGPPAGGAPGGGGGGRGGFGGGGWGMEPTITQTATTLTVKYMGGGQAPVEVTRTYKLDGTDSPNEMAGRGGGAPTTVISKAAWTGDKLVIKTPQGAGEAVMTVSLVAGKLTIETTAPGRGEGAAPTTSTVTYAKK